MSFIEAQIPPRRGRPRLTEAADKAAVGNALIGVEEITNFLRVLTGNPSLPVTRVNAWLAKGALPGSKLGPIWTAWKPALVAHFATPTNMRAVE